MEILELLGPECCVFGWVLEIIVKDGEKRLRRMACIGRIEVGYPF